MQAALRTHTENEHEQPWMVLKRSPIRKKLAFLVLFIRHVPALLPLLLALREDNVRRLVLARPEIFWILLTSQVAANWDCRTRVARLVDHCKTVADIGGIVDFPPDAIVEIMSLPAIDARYRITLDQARWVLREGPLVFSLWDGVDRIFHIAFCLANENGGRVAYIGAVQGRREIDMYNYRVDIHNSYRLFTKAAAGMRPRDFLIEAFKIFCKALGVSEIRAVSKSNHSHREADFTLPYDEIWAERGGDIARDGFFILSVDHYRRATVKIPAKKRSMYGKRYAMMDMVAAQLTAVVHSRTADAAARRAA